MKKTMLSISVLLLAVLVLSGCTTGNEAASPTPTAEATPVVTDAPTATDSPAANTGEVTFTSEELLKFDGSNGSPAYIAVDGVVYDVTNVPQWNEGLHNGFTAGRDLTNEIKTVSPHGVSKLVGLPVVGKLVD
ncbi:MAG TPA: cytochrome b5 domain-containing protein [Candidatus Limiplasma sp.]|nr:cytochrome b5 domain-containing protein [Candidatus Limiplasma sp.]HRX08536.1 cytochrome b5 domain-containing protein [Candidatus Limiplasma sp.]